MNDDPLPSPPSESEKPQQQQSGSQPDQTDERARESDTTFPVCPVCGGELVDIRQKLICSRCHTICETCCEGGRG